MRSTELLVAALVVVAAAATACGRERTTDPAPPAPPAASASATAPSCPEGQRALEQHVVSGSSACSSDADCACVDLPEAAATPSKKDAFCGLVVPKGRVAALRAENDRLAAAGCAPATSCPGGATCDVMCVPRSGGNYCAPRTRCREITVAADALVARLDRTCKRDADCAEYPAGLAQDCGGVASRASVEPLLTLAREFKERACPYSVNCAARAAFHPACRDGVCGG